MNIKLGWGWKIAVLYSAFVVMMVTLVVASSRQKIDLVSADYYKDEVAFQKVIDADRNQAQLKGTLVIHADSSTVRVDFPAEFVGKAIKGNITFYNPQAQELDSKVAINSADLTTTINRNQLKKTVYTLKIAYAVDGKEYYKEQELNLTGK